MPAKAPPRSNSRRPSDAWALGDQHRFAEDHLLHEAGQEIAATLFGTKAWRARADQCPKERARKPVKRSIGVPS